MGSSQHKQQPQQSHEGDAFYITKSQVLGCWWIHKKIHNHLQQNTEKNSEDSPSIAITTKEEAIALVKQLKSQFMRLRAQYFTTANSDGIGGGEQRIDYLSMSQSTDFQSLQELTQQLAYIPLSTMFSPSPSDGEVLPGEDVEQRRLRQVVLMNQQMAFFINLYNLLTIHSLCALYDTPTTTNGSSSSIFQQFGSSLWTRLTFYAENAYLIDHNAYCLNDIENGILRGNQVSPIPWSKKPFSDKDNNNKGEGDPRLSHCIAKPDPRIHFALNCGAMSCPPILVYDMRDNFIKQQGYIYHNM